MKGYSNAFDAFNAAAFSRRICGGMGVVEILSLPFIGAARVTNSSCQLQCTTRRTHARATR
jgi:hypothetical protein